MTDADRATALARLRREPPPLEQVSVVERTELSPRMLRLTFGGRGLRSLVVEQPAASVRLLVPSLGTDDLVIPEWNGNEFLLSDGSRPILRTFTPLRIDNASGRLDIEIVRHACGAVSRWAESAEVGAPAAISGPGSGYEFPTVADRLIVLGDETALPAMQQLAANAPGTLSLDIHVEVVHGDAVMPDDLRPGDTIEWHITEAGAVPGGRLVEVARSIEGLSEGSYLWAAGEASAMQAIRTHVFDTLGVPRKRATVRGYWKPAR